MEVAARELRRVGGGWETVESWRARLARRRRGDSGGRKSAADVPTPPPRCVWEAVRVAPAWPPHTCVARATLPGRCKHHNSTRPCTVPPAHRARVAGMTQWRLSRPRGAHVKGRMECDVVCRLLGDWDGGAVGRRSRAEGGGGHGGVEDGRNSSRRESLERL